MTKKKVATGIDSNIQEWLYDSHDRKSGVVINYKDFQELMSKLEDLHDLLEVYKRKASKTTAKPITLEELKKELFGKNAK